MSAAGSGPALLVIGVGNEYRSDDAAGLAVARRLRELGPEGLAVLEESGEGTALLAAWRGARSVILIDAIHSGAPPGTVRRLQAQRQTIGQGLFHRSTHAINVAEAIELARALDQLPARLVVYGIEGGSFQAGTGLSAVVEAAVEDVVARVLEEARAMFKLTGA